jgi:3-(3-hydroxy-phenyl)propionate hydroxylase
MCQGIRDVVNLAWKIDAVLKGEAGDALLDSYGIERGRHVRDLTTRLKGIGSLIGERDATRAAARDARLLAEAGGPVKPTPRQDVLPRLEGGALARDDCGARGTLFPQPWLQHTGERVRMDDAIGRGWRLVLRDAGQAVGGGMPGLRSLSLPALNECDGVLAAWFGRHRCTAALLRPDHYVFGTANDAAEVPDLLAQARAALR